MKHAATPAATMARMAVSVFDLFKIGIGPSSSHTVGPMRAARLFALRLAHEGLLERTARVRSSLFGSLGATGKGHGSDKAVLLGLAGHEPDTVDVERIPELLAAIRASGRVALLIGGEGSGLTDADIRQADELVTIPMAEPVESLNVAVAGAILVYAARRKRA